MGYDNDVSWSVRWPAPTVVAKKNADDDDANTATAAEDSTPSAPTTTTTTTEQQQQQQQQQQLVGPGGCRYHSAVLRDATVVVFGGQRGSASSLKDFWQYDLEKNEWTKMPEGEGMPSERFGHSAVVHGSKMYVFGGMCNKKSLNDFYAYDFDTKQWTHLQPAAPEDPWPGVRHHHYAFVRGNAMYIFGGGNGKKEYWNDLWKYDLEQGVFSKIATQNSPSPRAGHLGFVIQDVLYLYGGFHGDGGFEYFDDMYMLSLSSLESASWAPLAPEGAGPVTGRPMTGVVCQDIAYVFGGYDGQNPTAQLVSYHPTEKKWRTMELWMEMDTEAKMMSLAGNESSKALKPLARYGHSTVLSANNDIYVFAGSGSSYLNDVVRFALNVDPDE